MTDLLVFHQTFNIIIEKIIFFINEYFVYFLTILNKIDEAFYQKYGLHSLQNGSED
jgi:hypothetical protein